MSKNTGTSELINYFDLGANGDVGIAGSLDVNTIANATTDTDTFLVSDTGIIKYRTGAQLLSDIGAAPAVAGGYVPYTGAGANVDLGVYNLTAGAIIANGSGSNSGIVHLESNAIHSLVNGYGSIASGTTNQFNLYQTTGAGVFRGAILSLNSITASAIRTFTLPDADGTIALTSSLGAYLPLAGGTLTGALNGTSATFSTEVTSSGGQGRFGGWATGAGYQGNALEVGVSGGNAFMIGYNRTSGSYIPLSIGGTTNQTTTIGGSSIVFQNNGVTALTIASTGAATFSSSVTTGATINSGDSITMAGELYYGNVTSNRKLRAYSTGIEGSATLNYSFWNGSTWVIKSTLDYNGAATFSSSVTATGLIINNNGEALRAYGLSPNVSFYNSANTVRGGYVNHDGSNMNIVANVGGISLTGAATFSNSITTSGNINVNSDGIFINRSSSGEPYVFFQKNGVNRGAIYGVTGGGLRIFDESDNQVLTITGTNVLIGTQTNAGYKLDVNGSGRFGTIMLADRISLSTYPSLYGKKVVKADNVSSFTFNLSTIFPEMSSAFATNVVGCFGMYTIFRGGQGETGIFSISRNGSSWSSPSFSIQTATGAYSLSTVTASGTSITLVFNTNVYVMVEVTAMIE